MKRMLRNTSKTRNQRKLLSQKNSKNNQDTYTSKDKDAKSLSIYDYHSSDDDEHKEFQEVSIRRSKAQSKANAISIKSKKSRHDPAISVQDIKGSGSSSDESNNLSFKESFKDINQEIEETKSEGSNVSEQVETGNDHLHSDVDWQKYEHITGDNNSKKYCPVCNKEFSSSDSGDFINQHVNLCIDNQGNLVESREPFAEEINGKTVDITESDKIGFIKQESDKELARQLQDREKEKAVEEQLSENLFFCQFCQKDLTNFNSFRRQTHVNRCADAYDTTLKTDKENERKLAKEIALKRWPCLMCGKPNQSEKARFQHMKRCRKKNNVETVQLLELMRKDGSETTASLSKPTERNELSTGDSSTVSLANPTVNISKGKRKRPVIRNLDENTQLAMAVSASLVTEEKDKMKREKKGKRAKCVNELPQILTTSEKDILQIIAKNSRKLLQDEENEEEISCTPAMVPSKLMDVYLSGKNQKIQDDAEPSLVQGDKGGCNDEKVNEEKEDREVVHSTGNDENKQKISDHQNQRVTKVRQITTSRLWNLAAVSEMSLNSDDFYVPMMEKYRIEEETENFKVDGMTEHSGRPAFRRNVETNKGAEDTFLENSKRNGYLESVVDTKKSPAVTPGTNTAKEVLMQSNRLAENDSSHALNPTGVCHVVSSEEKSDRLRHLDESFTTTQLSKAEMLLDIGKVEGPSPGTDSWKRFEGPKVSSEVKESVIMCSGFCEDLESKEKEQKLQQLTLSSVSQLLKDLNTILKNSENTDLVIKCRDGDIVAHSLILFGRCGELSKLIQSSTDSRSVSLNEHSSASVNVILSYIYTGSIEIDLELLEEVTVLAERFCLEPLLEACVILNKNREVSIGPEVEVEQYSKKDLLTLLKEMWEDENSQDSDVITSDRHHVASDSEFDNSDVEDLREYFVTQVERKTSDIAEDCKNESSVAQNDSTLEDVFRKSIHSSGQEVSKSTKPELSSAEKEFLTCTDNTTKTKAESCESLSVYRVETPSHNAINKSQKKENHLYQSDSNDSVTSEEAMRLQTMDTQPVSENGTFLQSICEDNVSVLEVSNNILTNVSGTELVVENVSTNLDAAMLICDEDALPISSNETNPSVQEKNDQEKSISEIDRKLKQAKDDDCMLVSPASNTPEAYEFSFVTPPLYDDQDDQEYGGRLDSTRQSDLMSQDEKDKDDSLISVKASPKYDVYKTEENETVSRSLEETQRSEKHGYDYFECHEPLNDIPVVDCVEETSKDKGYSSLTADVTPKTDPCSKKENETLVVSVDEIQRSKATGFDVLELSFIDKGIPDSPRLAGSAPDSPCVISTQSKCTNLPSGKGVISVLTFDKGLDFREKENDRFRKDLKNSNSSVVTTDPPVTFSENITRMAKLKDQAKRYLLDSDEITCYDEKSTSSEPEVVVVSDKKHCASIYESRSGRLSSTCPTSNSAYTAASLRQSTRSHSEASFSDTSDSNRKHQRLSKSPGLPPRKKRRKHRNKNVKGDFKELLKCVSSEHCSESSSDEDVSPTKYHKTSILPSSFHGRSVTLPMISPLSTKISRFSGTKILETKERQGKKRKIQKYGSFKELLKQASKDRQGELIASAESPEIFDVNDSPFISQNLVTEKQTGSEQASCLKGSKNRSDLLTVRTGNDKFGAVHTQSPYETSSGNKYFMRAFKHLNALTDEQCSTGSPSSYADEKLTQNISKSPDQTVNLNDGCSISTPRNVSSSSACVSGSFCRDVVTCSDKVGIVKGRGKPPKPDTSIDLLESPIHIDDESPIHIDDESNHQHNSDCNESSPTEGLEVLSDDINQHKSFKNETPLNLEYTCLDSDTDPTCHRNSERSNSSEVTEVNDTYYGPKSGLLQLDGNCPQQMQKSPVSKTDVSSTEENIKLSGNETNSQDYVFDDYGFNCDMVDMNEGLVTSINFGNGSFEKDISNALEQEAVCISPDTDVDETPKRMEQASKKSLTNTEALQSYSNNDRDNQTVQNSSDDTGSDTESLSSSNGKSDICEDETECPDINGSSQAVTDPDVKPARTTEPASATSSTPNTLLKSFGPGCSVHPITGKSITPMPEYDAMATPELTKEVGKYGVRKLPKKKMAAKMKEIYKFKHEFPKWEETPKQPKAKRKKAGKELITTKTGAKMDNANSTDGKNISQDDRISLLDKDSLAVNNEAKKRKKDAEQSDSSGENNDGADRQQEFEGCADVDDDETDLPSSQKSEEGLNLSEKLYGFISGNKDLYAKVLRYERNRCTRESVWTKNAQTTLCLNGCNICLQEDRRVKPIYFQELHNMLKSEGIKCSQQSLMQFLDYQCICVRFTQEGCVNRGRRRRQNNKKGQ